MKGVFRAELLRWRRSNGLILLVLAALFSMLSAVIAMLGGGVRWDSYLASVVLWATGAAQPAAALLMALVNQRDEKARWGGAQWRQTGAKVLLLTRFCVVVVAILLMNVCVVLPPLIAGSLAIGGNVPLGKFAALALVLTIGACTLLPIYDLISRRLGLIVPIIIAGLWMIVGVLCAEKTDWKIIPPAWPIRALLPLLGTHANGTGLADTDPLRFENPMPATLLTLAVNLLIVILVLGGVRLAGKLSQIMAASRAVAPAVTSSTESFRALPTDRPKRVETRPWRAQFLSFKRTPVFWVPFVGLFLQCSVWFTWRGFSNYTVAFFQLVVIPLEAALLGVLGWSCHAGALRITATHVQGVVVLTVMRMLALWMVDVFALLAGTVFLALAHVDGAVMLRTVLVGASLAWMLTTLGYWLAARWGEGVAYAVQGAGFVLGLITGSGAFGTMLWPVSPWAWAYEPTTIGWGPTIAVTVVCACTGGVILCLAIAASHRHMLA